MAKRRKVQGARILSQGTVCIERRNDGDGVREAPSGKRKMVYVCMGVCGMYVCMYVCICMSVCMYMYGCVYVCMYVYIYMRRYV